ncbi:peptidase S8 and S53 subtilisin kexin sedolisin [Xanthobacter versatilis]|uniref:Peptidase S8 and S53 subtilisin kexin sedolisin n=1 Tax=Xanthobacter autotrophicus (strain ATCC BAA-1158 / Py2) TaxID=78245 RepID=A7IE95_XANP2|nr:peptidase S8 and S53 subtilisin kexin sedolisin [Xanthobacter autotrophicus Py2]
MSAAKTEDGASRRTSRLRRHLAISTHALRQRPVNLAITFAPADPTVPGPTRLGFAASGASLEQLRPDPLRMDMALHQLSRMGVSILSRGSFSASAQLAPDNFEKLFGTRLSRFRTRGDRPAFLFPHDGGPWSPQDDIARLIDDAYIQWPATPMTTPPAPIGAFGPDRVYLPNDLANLLNASGPAVRGMSGAGVRVAMVDTGFSLDHPYFLNRRFSVLTAPGADGTRDRDGHGTAMCANLFAIAPDIDFIGISLGLPDGSVPIDALHGGILLALAHQPDILVLSIAYDLRSDITDLEAERLPGSCVALALQLQNAVARGVTVVCAGGNGQFAFPAMLPEVIAAGGCVVDAGGEVRASNIASGFRSNIYPGRTVPDVCGIAGSLEKQAYLMLPCPPGSWLDRSCAGLPDGTGVNDGWCFTGGTSAAAPQVAAVCALMLQANPKLTARDIRSVLNRTASDVAFGTSSAMTGGRAATIGNDLATGFGLVNAGACLHLI